MSIRLYVGNLPSELDRQALEKIFNESGDSVSLKVITDRKTGRCRGFGFVTVGTPELADTVIEKFNGFDFNGAVLKLEKALPRSKGKSEDGEGGEESPPDAEGTPSVAVSTVPAPTPKTAASKRSKSKRSGGGRTASTSSSSTSLEAHQPDPRWANELEKFKQQLLAAQAVN
ncbi:RNA-binding protein [Tumidithrix elongata RA019]|uniref:RNA-binding protein n=1 Tax=Tumidithrix elongata BACA0141 TaxID=2716417 RepID=A0AAW9PXL6_9CYAN|nr:RNA-binding protein [Tumidithrix elongata RA019]